MLPWLSLIVTMVLLNEEWMCATPAPTFLNSRFLRVLVCFLAANQTPTVYLAPRNEPGVSSPRPETAKSDGGSGPRTSGENVRARRSARRPPKTADVEVYTAAASAVNSLGGRSPGLVRPVQVRGGGPQRASGECLQNLRLGRAGRAGGCLVNGPCR